MLIPCSDYPSGQSEGQTPAPFVSDSEAAHAIAQSTGNAAMSDLFVNVDFTSLAGLHLDQMCEFEAEDVVPQQELHDPTPVQLPPQTQEITPFTGFPALNSQQALDFVLA